MPEKNELVAYAMDFASYLISKVENINRIILYGSVARGDFDEKSDVDIFIDSNEKLQNKKEQILKDYYKTKKFNEWKLKGINNAIAIIVGRLDGREWKELKRAMMNTGIIIYGKYKEKAEKVNQYALFSFENIKPDKRRVLVFRKLFGFNMKGKKYWGLAEKVRAIRIGKGSILVPIEHAQKVIDFFRNEKVKVKVYDLWSDEKI